MEDWKIALSELADPGEFEVEGGQVLFSRLGRNHSLEISQQPDLGIAVEVFDDQRLPEPIQISVFIQSHILDLARFSKQITRALEQRSSHHAIPYIDVAARHINERGTELAWDNNTSHRLRELLLKTEPGVTRIIQLMAPAGHGKTALLEKLALTLAREYFPSPFPRPFLLPVDLLGRYVGNAEDAIAGSLNNLFRFPLSQKDIIQVMKRHWLILALDGFDELVARTSLREAFLRITELVDQLEGSGTVILSARETFFNLWQVTTAIRTYLQPKRGTYSTYSVELSQWQETQAIQVFSHLGSPSPATELALLQEAFGSDSKILFNPFLLIKVAQLWTSGERFQSIGNGSDPLGGVNLVVSTFVNREAFQKWKDREENIILPLEAHYEMLAAVAEEMWMSNAMHLDHEELGLAAEIGLSQRRLSHETVDAAKSRIATHAAFASYGKLFRFIHDQFFYYFLGNRVARLISENRPSELLAIFGRSELPPAVGEWITFFLNDMKVPRVTACAQLANPGRIPEGEYEPTNMALLLAVLLDGERLQSPIVLHHLIFTGSVLLGRKIEGVTFKNCRFWNADLSDCTLANCLFDKCDFATILVGRSTLLYGSSITDCSLSRFEFVDVGGLYSPSEINKFIADCGASVCSELATEEQLERRISSEALRCLELFVKRSGRGSDVVVEDVSEYFPRYASAIAKLAIDFRIAREAPRSASGTRKTFLRFIVEKDRLLAAHSALSGNEQIDGFWAALEKRFSR